MVNSLRTPLLLLLDSVVSQDRERLELAIQQIHELVDRELPVMPRISDIVKNLLEVHPNLAFVPSEHDNSLPMHFAASIGDTDVANILYRYVRLSKVMLKTFREVLA
jgi:hypothetical protein